MLSIDNLVKHLPSSTAFQVARVSKPGARSGWRPGVRPFPREVPGRHFGEKTVAIREKYIFLQYLYTLCIAYTVYIIHYISYILILTSFLKVYSNNFGYSLWVAFMNKTLLNSKGQVLPIRSYTVDDKWTPVITFFNHPVFARYYHILPINSMTQRNPAWFMRKTCKLHPL